MYAVKKISALLFVGVLLFAGVKSVADTEAVESGERCHGYCILESLGEIDGKPFYSAQRCSNCGEVNLLCAQQHDIDGSACSNCKGNCPGHDLPDCRETADKDLMLDSLSRIQTP